ncbi:metallopeptidase TldD-related protein [candidate division CSSED10-310 bacterium]|uniref:Metallopeptidase TldD-related protein n=1 Tax=candidate division CSSED10-310 bacterium TaxID=2855610 RepID=A0ABV6Z6T6_UNCC1
MPSGRASVAFDDDGVPASRWFIIKNGILNGYSTTRDTASFLGDEDSKGCSYADSWNSMPILRMPNVSIEPGQNGSPLLKDIIASTDQGILIDGRGSFSIDHQRINFQFGGDYCRKITNGRLDHALRRVTYQSHNPYFWSSVDAIAPQAEWQQHGITNCGKGQPMQVGQLTHGSAPLRVKKVKIGRART